MKVCPSCFALYGNAAEYCQNTHPGQSVLVAAKSEDF